MIRKILLSLLILIAATSVAQAAEEEKSAEQNFNERKANLAEVSDIRVGYGSGTIRIVVDITKKVDFKDFYIENPSRVIIDLKDSWLSPNVKREIELKSLAAKKIRVGQFDSSTVRIVIETMADMKTFHLDGGPKGHRFVIDVGNADFKVNPELNKPDDNSDAELKAKQEAELKAKQEAELKAKQDAELKAKQDAELKAKQDAELKAKQDAELREQQERERELERRERELAQRERELKEQEERELREKQERELKEKQERELKAQQERERELERRERELEQREREFKEKQERELKKRQERELKEQQELKEKQEKELKKQQERELKEKREKEIKAQREREKELKEKEKQERREKKDKEKKDKDKTDDEKETDEPIKELDSDLDEIMALSGKKIVIDPGHGGNDAGAIGPTGVMEKSVTLKVGLELKRLLEAEGATVIMTRETDTTVSSKGAKASDIEELGARCDVANRNGADIFISIHADSFTRPEARGTTGYYYSKSTSGRGQKLADCIRRNLVEQLGTPSRGTQPCNFYVVKNTDMPATLIELGFISNKDEEKLLDSKEGVQKAAQGILDGIEDYFG